MSFLGRNLIDFREMKAFSEANPDATLQDYINGYVEKVEKNDEMLREQALNRDKWYESCVGRYFVINHNDKHYLIVHITDKNWYKDIHQKMRGYDVTRTEKEFSIDYDYHIVNPVWFHNPYAEYDMGGGTKVIEINEELFQKVEEFYKNIKKLYGY